RQPGRPQASRRRGRRPHRAPARGQPHAGDGLVRVRRFEWEGAAASAAAVRAWVAESATVVDVAPIESVIREGGDAAVIALTNRYDATERPLAALRVDPAEATAALAALDP